MPGILCEHCTGVCCRYIALPIETPTDKSDFDDIRWYLLHEGIGVFVEDGDWYITMTTTCRHLQPDNRCGIYATRPRICREYSTDSCDYHSGDYNWQHHFATPEHLDEYVREHFARGRTNGRRGRGATRRSRPIRGGVRGKLRGRRKPAYDYAAATRDVRGVPLPVLPAASPTTDPA